MSRTVIVVNEHHAPDDGHVNIIIKPMWPNNVQDRDSWVTLECDIKAPPISELADVNPGDEIPFSRDLVTAVGDSIRESLGKHQGISQAIDSAINTQAHETWPVQFYMSGFTTESLPLETLHCPNTFLALEPRYSLSRVVQNTNQALLRSYIQPLKMVAVIAAADREPLSEWHSIFDSIQDSKMDVELTVMLANDELQQVIEIANLDWVKIERIPGSANELVSKILHAQPQILHFFCHGEADQSGSLQIATPGLVSGVTDVPLFFEARHFTELRNCVWLVVLNACEGATSTDGAQSLAFSLVDAGMPAAIGVREVVGTQDASKFCNSFYSAALRDLKQQLVSNTKVTLDWAPYVSRARAAMCEAIPGPLSQTAGSQKAWTLYVLYQREDLLEVQSAPDIEGGDAVDIAELMGALQQARVLLENLHPDTPEHIRLSMQQFIDGLETQLANMT